VKYCRQAMNQWPRANPGQKVRLSILRNGEASHGKFEAGRRRQTPLPGGLIAEGQTRACSALRSSFAILLGVPMVMRRKLVKRNCVGLSISALGKRSHAARSRAWAIARIVCG